MDALPAAVPPASPWTRVSFLIITVLLLRLAYVALFAVNPAGDEAYYWDWSRQLDYGYYSKPPGIAWLYALVDRGFGGGIFAVRATAAVLGTASLCLLYGLACDLYDARTGWYALLLGLVAPANAVLSHFLTIDAPLVICWSTALWTFWRVVSGQGGRRALILLFLALSLGHLFKQMMMVFPLLALLFLAGARETRSHLRKGALWVVLIGSYLSLLPPLIWNIQNDWITFQHTRHHFESGPSGGAFLLERAEDFLSFLGTQLGVLSPGTAFVVFSLSLVGLRGLAKAPRPHRFLLYFGALPLAAMLLLALRQEMQPNWAAVYYLSGIVLAAAWYSGKLSAPFPPPRLRRLLPYTLATGLLLSAYFYLAPPLFAAFGQAGHKADPDRRLLGHDRLAAAFESIRREQADGESCLLIALGHRDLASHLAFALPDRPRIYRWESSGKIVSQYELWNHPIEDGFAGRDALLLVPNGELPHRLSRAFESVEVVGEFEVKHGPEVTRRYVVYRGHGLKHWPEGKR